MPTILAVDDEPAMRHLVRLNLADFYTVIDTGAPDQAFALALEHKPDVILLDLTMPRYSGFELCQILSSSSATQLIPIVIVSGHPKAQAEPLCRELGATAFFQKPVDFEALLSRIASLTSGRRKERRAEVRVRLRVSLRLSGTDQDGQPFRSLTTTLNVSRGSFLCGCPAALAAGTRPEVTLIGPEERLAGTAEMVRSEWNDTAYPRYAFRFLEMNAWILD